MTMNTMHSNTSRIIQMFSVSTLSHQYVFCWK